MKPHGYLIRCCKSVSQCPTPLHDKSLGEISGTRNIPKHKKAIYNKLTANIKLKREKLKAILLKSGR